MLMRNLMLTCAVLAAVGLSSCRFVPTAEVEAASIVHRAGAEIDGLSSAENTRCKIAKATDSGAKVDAAKNIS